MIGLSNPQKQLLCRLARRGWRLACASMRGERGPAAAPPEFDAWRHDQVRCACGKLGLRLCVQSDFPWLMAHFHRLVGEDGVALKWEMRAQEAPRDQAWVALERLLSQRGISPNYAEAVCRDMFDCNLAAARTEQLWKLRGILLHRGSPAHAT